MKYVSNKDFEEDNINIYKEIIIFPNKWNSFYSLIFTWLIKHKIIMKLY